MGELVKDNADMLLKRNSLARSELEAWRTWTTFKIYLLHVMFTYERWKKAVNCNSGKHWQNNFFFF